jgi:hypothetical protein
VVVVETEIGGVVFVVLLLSVFGLIRENGTAEIIISSQPQPVGFGGNLPPESSMSSK